MSIPPPEGMTEVDYDAIEAAVTETVRGRWFLNEFARRTRAGEMRQVLDAMARIETRIESAAIQPALPSADPSVRMLIQRIKEIAGHLDGLSQEMREEGIEARFAAAVEDQARAVSGMMRSAAPARPVGPPIAEPKAETVLAPAALRMPRANLPLSLATPPSVAARAATTPLETTSGKTAAATSSGDDPRLAALSALDRLPLAKKLAVFS